MGFLVLGPKGFFLEISGLTSGISIYFPYYYRTVQEGNPLRVSVLYSIPGVSLSESDSYLGNSLDTSRR